MSEVSVWLEPVRVMHLHHVMSLHPVIQEAAHFRNSNEPATSRRASREWWRSTRLGSHSWKGSTGRPRWSAPGGLSRGTSEKEKPFHETQSDTHLARSTTGKGPGDFALVYRKQSHTITCYTSGSPDVWIKNLDWNYSLIFDLWDVRLSNTKDPF